MDDTAFDRILLEEYNTLKSSSLFVDYELLARLLPRAALKHGYKKQSFTSNKCCIAWIKSWCQRVALLVTVCFNNPLLHYYFINNSSALLRRLELRKIKFEFSPAPCHCTT